MKLSEMKENRKVFLISILVVISIAGLFLSACNYLLLTQFNQPATQELPYQDVPLVNESGSDYKKAGYSVVMENDFVDNSNALTAEEAAESGARYLWEVLNVDLNGKTINMLYAVDPSRAIAYWHGSIDRDGGEWEGIPEYTFSVDAISGKWSSVYYVPSHDPSEPIMYLEEEANEYYRENGSEFLEIAGKYASRQTPYEIVSAEFHATSIWRMPGFMRDNEQSAGFKKALGDDVIWIPEGEPMPAVCVEVIVYVTDAAGNQFEVTIDSVSKDLYGINELYHGVNYSPDGLG